MVNLPADNKVINGLWGCFAGETLSNLERLCIYSFCAHGHDFHLWSYHDIPNVPKDASGGKVVVRDAADILPQSKIFRRKGGLSHFSDWWRWEFMRKVGGWYADMDIVCLRPIDFADDIVVVKLNWKTLHAHFMKFPKGHYVAEAMAFSCAHPGRIMPWDKTSGKFSKIARTFCFWKSAHQKQRFGESGGPKGFSLAARHFGLFKNAKSSEITENVSRWGVNYYFNDAWHQMEILHPMLRHSCAFHISNSGIVHFGYDKNGVYHPNSPFEVLKRRYLPELQK